MIPTAWASWLGGWRLAEPWGLLVLLLVPWPWVASLRRGRIAWPSFDGFCHAPKGRAGLLRHVPSMLKSLAIICLAVAMARPQAVGGRQRIAARGVAIEAALDRSSSMTAKDFPAPNGPTSRLDAAVATFSRFVDGRPDDLIGLVAFAGIADRVAAPTLDHGFVLDAARAIRPARVGEAGTNLGHAIALGLGELRAVKTPKKVLVLITDGQDEPPKSESFPPIAPEDAARLAPGLGVTLHTIAVGRPEPLPNEAADSNADPGPDLKRLEALAKLGGGKAFVATNEADLLAIFAAIDALEKSPLTGLIRTRYREGYPPWIGLAMAMLALERLLASGPLRRLP